MNYDCLMTDIEDLRKEYPNPNNPEVAKRFKSLDEYLTIAKKVIRTFGPQLMPKTEVERMLRSENAVSEIARHIMMADWGYEETKGRTEYSYRNQCGIWAIQDFIGLAKTKANQPTYSLDMPINSENDNQTPLSSLIEDTSATESPSIVNNKERKERISKYTNFLIKNSKLTKVQAKCIELHYMQGVKSHTEIGQHFDPPISRQGIKQNLDRALFKLRMTAKGTGK